MLDFLKDVALKAGKIIKENFLLNNKVYHKGKIDLVTEIDIKVENFIKEKLSKHFDKVKIIAEESFEGDFQNDNVFFIDPIDGTTNFVHRFPFVAVSIAYYSKDCQIGVVYNPIIDELFYAQTDKGAFLNGVQIFVSKNESINNSLIATGFPYSSVEKNIKELINILERILKSSRGVRRAGSAALDLCYVAKGVFDGYYETGLKPWDVAAGMVIVKEAGGVILNRNGRNYNFVDDYIVATNGKITDDLLGILNGV
ncbi:inositol monophosphatase family protein [Deferribacter thermophilus]|uniref:inositol monophosphatase family protein n=1 Tax=Deferribacter thermophilus TaxID=53573 RepID=UPI003C1711C2